MLGFAQSFLYGKQWQILTYPKLLKLGKVDQAQLKSITIYVSVTNPAYLSDSLYAL